MKNLTTPIQQLLAEATRYTLLTKLKWSKIAFLSPIKQRNGRNACRVYYVDSSYDDVAHTCIAVLNQLAKYHLTTVENARELTRSCPWARRQRRVNMLLDVDCTVVPLIAVETVDAHSSRVGYLIKQHLYSAEPLADGTLIKFYKEHEGIRIIQHEPSVHRQLVDAELLEQHYHELLTKWRQESLEQETAHSGQIGRYK